MRSLLPYAVAGLGLASMLAAQNTATFPSYAANVEGNASNPYSPLSYGVVRFQSIFDKAELTIPNNALIKSIGYRQDCTYRQPSPAGFKLQIEVRLGRTPKGDDVSTVFANNYSPTAPPTTVFPKGFYDLPTLPAPTATLPNPSGNVAAILLTTPYVHDSSSNLLVEYLLYASQNGNQQFAYYIDSMSHNSVTTSFGTACTTSANTTPVLTANSPGLGQYWSLSLTKGPNVAPTGLFVGASNTSWAGGSLPYDLAALGAPGCSLLVDPLVTLSATTGGSGSASYSFYLPQVLAYNGATLYAQSAMYDPFANSFGIVMSNGVKSVFGYPARSYGCYAPNNVNAVNGSTYTTDGTVVVFTY